jgi:Icc-related predicted phosphoesterase
LRLAAVGDLHCGRASQSWLSGLLSEVAAVADVLMLCGDLTDHGLPDEAHLLAKELRSRLTIPIVAVLGNHDHESGQAEAVSHILGEAAVTVLDGDSVEVHGIGIAGVKGFGGGFGENALQAWGEDLIKRFVHEAIAEALKLESAIARLKTEHRVALLHYAPIQATIEGEAPATYPFLGSSRLEEPLTRHSLTAIFHGHAHHGRPQGETRTGVPVYNVAAPLLQEASPQHRAFHLLELPRMIAHCPPEDRGSP